MPALNPQILQKGSLACAMQDQAVVAAENSKKQQQFCENLHSQSLQLINNSSSKGPGSQMPDSLNDARMQPSMPSLMQGNVMQFDMERSFSSQAPRPSGAVSLSMNPEASSTYPNIIRRQVACENDHETYSWVLYIMNKVPFHSSNMP